MNVFFVAGEHPAFVITFVVVLSVAVLALVWMASKGIDEDTAARDWPPVNDRTVR